MHSPIAYFITALLYAAFAVVGWRTAMQFAGQGGAAAAGLETKNPLTHFFIPVAWLLHGAVLFASVFEGDGLNFGIGNALSMVMWLTVGIYWLANFYYRLDVVNSLVLAAAAVCVMLALLLPAGRQLNYVAPAFKWHLVISMLAYSLFTIAALHAVLILLQEKRLHNAPGHRAASSATRNLPPLIAMETLLFRILWAGFILLTATVLSGIFFSEELFGKALDLRKHKTVFALVSWLIFAALLLGRQLYGWRGRIAVRFTLAGFAALVFAYVGSKFVMEVILQRVS
jgi:ABC-type uncharacterized transport system permease subunit